jgi:hypothetical protein
LYVWIHECGHVRLRHAERAVFHHVAEFEAEEFAHVVFAEEGLEVPESMTRNAETNVRINLMKDMLLYGFGCAIDPRVVCWLDGGGCEFNKEMK